MKLEIPTNKLVSGSPVCYAIHGDSTLAFTVSSFGRNNFTKGFDVFEHINQFWSEQTEEFQKNVFNLYKDINDVFLAVAGSDEEMKQELIRLITKLTDMHDYQTMYDWMIFRSNIIVPERIESDYVQSPDRQGSREQTYIKSDYTKLVAMVLVLRTMIPVWGVYISNTRKETGNTFKEFYAIQLLQNTKIYQSEPMNKVRSHIECRVQDDKFNPATIIDGICSEDFPLWMLGLTVIKRLCVGDIRGIDPHVHLVSYMYKFISHKMNGDDIKAEDMVKPKTAGGDSKDLEAKLSTLERYKIKFDVAMGDIEELEYIINGNASPDSLEADMTVVRLAQRLSSHVTDQMVMDAIRSSQQLLKHDLYPPQITLMQWVMKPVLPPRGAMYLSKPSIVKALAVTQAVLWARGHKTLALIASSYVHMDDYEMVIGSVESRQRIPKELLARLDELYPYHRIQGGKKSGQKPVNNTVKSIEILADNLGMFPRVATASSQYTAEVLGKSNSRRIQIPANIKILLAELVIEIGAQSWV